MDQTNCRVRLTSRQSLLDDATSLRRDSESRDFQESFDENGSFRPLDPYYQTHPEAWEEAIRNSRSEQLQAEQEFRQLENRPIFSPFYFRGSQSEAIAQLESKPVGSCLFRPSPRGIDQIILTFKLLDDLIVSYDVLEDQKDPDEPRKLGAVLHLCDETYADLEEIVDRFVNPVVSLAQAVSHYSKFVPKIDEEVDTMVREEFQKKPSFLPYLVSISRKPPGLLRLTYCKRGDVLHEYAELRPAGILYDQRIFHHVESFVAYFKKNIKRIYTQKVQQARASTYQRQAQESSMYYGRQEMDYRSMYGQQPPMYQQPPYGHGYSFVCSKLIFGRFE